MAIERKQRLAPPFSVRLPVEDLQYAELTARDGHMTVSDILRDALRLHRKEAAKRALVGDSA
ncbi:hypothetical protein EN814_09740 [Mesorhizobium sp. M2D.F.Ca.ET.171.01.1.1]|uniref:hypothetical protein n=1 Tax=unclassified Mesorhizobium TaxID=325217 RepID=UPI00109323D2|nr:MULTISPECIES: hypothetical protein [unclassified Mesorhizobium]TGS97465.1 hypothetical protein EN821_09735 [Mesorhizobium sp. M2D.F.Ca.ET.178.01.1.1]TGT12036.1 hypothetical protein EN814_09740 [Mesorhizobium sp. M2D.F.Ca.ET.171.01.1.1]